MSLAVKPTPRQSERGPWLRQKRFGVGHLSSPKSLIPRTFHRPRADLRVVGGKLSPCRVASTSISRRLRRQGLVATRQGQGQSVFFDERVGRIERVPIFDQPALSPSGFATDSSAIVEHKRVPVFGGNLHE